MNAYSAIFKWNSLPLTIAYAKPFQLEATFLEYFYTTHTEQTQVLNKKILLKKIQFCGKITTCKISCFSLSETLAIFLTELGIPSAIYSPSYPVNQTPGIS